MRRVSLNSAHVCTRREFGNDLFVALFSGLFDRYTAKATASPFPRILDLVGSVAHMDAFNGVRGTEPIASCVVIICTGTKVLP